jgi:hypothetical protein
LKSKYMPKANSKCGRARVGDPWKSWRRGEMALEETKAVRRERVTHMVLVRG